MYKCKGLKNHSANTEQLESETVTEVLKVSYA